MGDIEWTVRSIWVAMVNNDTTMWIMGFMLIVLIFNIILGVFYDNNK